MYSLKLEKMACNGCESTECLTLKINPCSEGVSLGINATYTGNVSGDVFFNGIWRSFIVAVESGQPIIIPTSVLNSRYVHEAKLYNDAGELIGCYELHTRTMRDAPIYAVPPANSDNVFNITVATAGNTITDSRFTNKTVMLLTTDAQSYNSAFFIKPFSSNTLTSSTLSFYVGQIVTITLI